jgi:2-C-methyl-D-erythritol 4-phosphate cytidylyltransferase
LNKYAVIVAGGVGQRMGSSIPKQFLLLHGKPVLWHTIQTFLEAYNDMKIILVLPEDFIAQGREVIKDFNEDRIVIAAGGNSRFQSVKNGLALIQEQSIVFVQDAVRCLVSKKLIHKCYEQALEKGSAVPAVTATDSIRIIEDDSHHQLDRHLVRIIQTPQTFRSDILLSAFNVEFNESFTDEATVVEAAGQEVFLIEGEYSNIKITRPIDMFIAEKLSENTRQEAMSKALGIE